MDGDEIELEENDNRKDLTVQERRHTFAASKRAVESAKKAGGILSSATEDKPKPRGHKATYGVPKDSVADSLGVSVSTLVEAEHHVETAERFPFMKGEAWRQSGVEGIGV